MPESAELQFIKETVAGQLAAFSATNLFACTETGRKQFDLSLHLASSWQELLAGQVLWTNAPGVDKDIRTLLLDSEATVRLYAVRDTVAHRGQLVETLSAFRRSADFRNRLGSFRIILVPADFDADKSSSHATVTQILETAVARDLLLGTVFGGITSHHPQVLAEQYGQPGLAIAAMQRIRDSHPMNQSDLVDLLALKSTAGLREKLSALVALGLLDANGTHYRLNRRGTVFLDIAAEIYYAMKEGRINTQLRALLNHLDLSIDPGSIDPNLPLAQQATEDRLIAHIMAAQTTWNAFPPGRSASPFQRIHRPPN